MPLSPRTLRPASSGFNPRQISGLALWLDGADSSTLFQNSDGTVPATATSDPVGYWADKSGNARHATQATGANRPAVSAANTNNRMSVSFTGSSITGAGNQLKIAYPISDNELFTVICVMREAATPTPGLANRVWMGNLNAPSDFYHALNTWGSSTSTQGIQFYSSGQYSWLPNPGSSPHIISISKTSTASTNAGVMHFDGALGCYSSNVSPFSYLPTTSLANFGIGRLVNSLGATNNGGSSFTGQILELIAYPRVLASDERRRVERYLAAKWGIAIAPQVSNADAQDWVNRVYINGGAVSVRTAAAVNQFCVDIEAASIRDRFFRLNLFCGTGLNACLVPLYRGQSIGGTQYGGTVDTNAGSSAAFIGADYTESSGLLCNGAKYLMLGTVTQLKPSWATHHFGLDIKDGFPDATTRYQMGAYFNETRNASRGWYTLLGSGSSFKGFDSGSSSRYGISADANMKMVVRSASTDMRLYEDGTQISTTQASPDTATVLPGGQFCVGAVSYQNVDGGGTPTTIVNGYAPAVGTLRGYSIGESMSDAQRLAFASAWSAFRTAMGRT